jgi:ADP-ribose pyrophosphatase
VSSSHDYAVVDSTERFAGRVIRVRTDTVRMPQGGTAERDIVEHPGAVGVLALDDEDRVVMVRQYRPAVGTTLLELPAGLRDHEGEEPLATAARELAEEAGVRATDWQVLADTFASPGMSDEATRVYLARGLSDIPAAERSELVDEEMTIDVERIALPDAVAMVLDGRIRNAMCVIGVLAAAQAQRTGFGGLRDAATPWPA